MLLNTNWFCYFEIIVEILQILVCNFLCVGSKHPSQLIASSIFKTLAVVTSSHKDFIAGVEIHGVD